MVIPPNLPTNHVDNVNEFITAGLVNDLATAANAVVTGVAVVDKGGQVYNAAAYGLSTLNTATANLTAIQAAITAATTGGGTVYLPAGTFACSGSITGANGVAIQGAGMDKTVLSFTDDAPLSIQYTRYPDGTGLALASNVAIGDRTITLATGLGVAVGVGSIIAVSDAQVTNGTWIAKVSAVAGDVLTLEDGSPLNFLVASTAVISYWYHDSMLQGVHVSDLTLTMASASLAATRSIGIQLIGCENVIIERVKVRYHQYEHFRLWLCRDARMLGCVADTASPAGGGLGYSAWYSTGTQWTDCIAHMTGFGLACYYSPRSKVSHIQIHGRQYGRGIKFQNGSNFSTCESPTIEGCTLIGIYCVSSAYCAISNVNISNIAGIQAQTGVTLAAGQQIGGPLDAHHNTLSGGIIRNTAGPGVEIYSRFGTPSDSTHCTVTGVIMENVAGGVALFGSDNVVSGCSFNGYGTVAPAIGAIVGNPAPTATGNLITGCSFNNGGVGVAYDGTNLGGCVLVGNTFNGEAFHNGGNDLLLNAQNGALQSMGPQHFIHSWTDASNYDQLEHRWTGIEAQIVTTAAGSGVAHGLGLGTTGATPLNLYTNGTVRWQIDSQGRMITGQDNTFDIGYADGSFRARNIYLAGAIGTKVKAGTPVDSDISSPVDGMLVLDSAASKIWARIGGVWKGATLT